MILVVGMARSGIAAAKLLQSRGASVFVTDSGSPSTSELQAAGIPFETGGHTIERFLEAEEIVVSPGVPLDIAPLKRARERNVPVSGELEIACRYLQGTIVGITGSNGKTTTTTLIGEILHHAGRAVQVGGNIGTPMTALVEHSTSQTINVVEVSSFQLDTIQRFQPHIGVLLNITPDHLDRYADFQAYRLSKFRLFENQTPGDFAVLNLDDTQVWPSPVQLNATVAGFSQQQSVAGGSWREGDHLVVQSRRLMPVTDIPLRGRHNVENVLAAVTAATLLGVSDAVIAQAVRGFKAVEHRLEFVANIRGADFFNDSKATNVDSAIKAVEAFPGNLIVILGGKDKGSPYEPLVHAMTGRVKRVVLLGAAAPKIQQAIGERLPVTTVRTMDEAVRAGLDLSSPGDVILLSPACASFDMFDNYEHRGRVFKEVVHELAADRRVSEDARTHGRDARSS